MTNKQTALLTIASLLVAATAFPVQAHAQFFKQLLNTAKQTAQNHANDKTGQTTNGVLDKLDSSLHFKGKTSSKGTRTATTAGSTTNGVSTPLTHGAPGDTSATRRVFGAFAQAAADNPNDTSGADLTMKALGRLSGGGGVSAADSAKAIKSFMTANGGSGLYYVYVTTVSYNKKINRDTSYSWFTGNGEGRKESRIIMPGAASGKIIALSHIGQPQYFIDLDPVKRTYSLEVIDTSLINAAHERWQVTRLGTETVNGFPCTHARLTSTTGSGAFRSSSTTDIWTSTAVPGYAMYSKMIAVQGIKVDMLQALDKAGAAGFIVKFSGGDKNYTMSMELVTAQTKNCPASLFQIPSGYTHSDEGIANRLLSGAKK